MSVGKKFCAIFRIVTRANILYNSLMTLLELTETLVLIRRPKADLVTRVGRAPSTAHRSGRPLVASSPPRLAEGRGELTSLSM